MRKLLPLLLLLSACVISAPDYSDIDGGGDDIDAETDVTLTITLGGNSVGTVTSPDGIDCGVECEITVPSGTTVTLTAVPDANTEFTGWSGGGCSGTATCQVTLTADTTVSAAFDLARYTVTVTPGGNGTGTVTSDPIGIACGADCSQDYDHGTSVTLTATPDVGSTFVGWTGGGCTGTDPCTITVTAALDVQGSFALDNSIIVTLAGNGTGGVTSNPGGINCGGDCSEAYAPGTPVTLTATATGDSVFDGWTGGCVGTGTCQVTTNDAVLVTATFVLNQHTLQVVPTGTGTGTITSNIAGIDCPGDCTHSYDSGTTVVLTATPTAGRFAGWTGDCSGLGTCTAMLTVSRSVTATFTLITVVNVTSTTTNGIYTNPTTIPIRLTFTDPVTVTGTPTLTLNSGGAASYVSGSGSTALIFNYVVAPGHASSDLDYTSADALTLSGGTIEDSMGNDATLTLPLPGDLGSLGANRNIVIDAVLPVVSAVTGPPTYAASTSAALSYTVTELHPGVTNCNQTVGTGTVVTCTTTGATFSGLSQGAHTVSITHTDTAGNVSTAQTHSWTVDTVAPVVSVITGPASPTTSTSATLSYTVTETNPGSTSCAHGTGTGTQTACNSTTASYTGLSNTGHSVSVTHTDLAGNTSTASTYAWSVCPATTVTFTTVSTGGAFTVPSGCATRMDVYAWGAGGGGGGPNGQPNRAGSGGFAGGTLVVSPGQTFQIAVGGGGSSIGIGGTNGGGSGASGGGSGAVDGGGGGGWSGVYGGSPATYYVIAGAGGGNGGTGGGSLPVNGGGGAGGGGATGETGYGNGDSAGGGGGGSQTAGGAGGSWAGGGANGTAGASRQAGNGGAGTTGGGGGGGGGAGYFGGGGGAGARINSSIGYAGYGGGGGSSYTALSLTGGATLAATPTGDPGNTASPYYISPRGFGGTPTLAGNPGLVVLVLR